MRDAAHSRNVRDAILDATDELLARFGYRKMTIDDLAREVGIGKGTVYLHFPSKEEIALSHIDRIIDRLKARLWEIADSRLDPEQKLIRMLSERVMYRFDSVQHYTTSLNELLAQVRPRLLERRKRYFGEEARIFEKVISEGVAAGAFEGSPEDLAFALMIATNALLPYSLSTHELGSRGEIADRTNRLANLLLTGVKARH
jgi:AcrR family transcriptional regulator